MTKPPALGSPRFFRLCWLIIREAHLGGRLLCRIGIHKWDVWSERIDAKMIRTHNDCKRCGYAATYTTTMFDPSNW